MSLNINENNNASFRGGLPPAVSDDEQTLADSGFYWRECDGVRVLMCRGLEENGFTNGFSTRLGGVSFGSDELNLAGFNEDEAENIHENRRRFLSVFDGNYQLAVAWQVHGDTIRNVKSAADIGDSDERADAVISNLEGVLAGVKTADCVPVLIGDPATGAFAAVHAGWRGTVQSIVQKAVRELGRAYAAKPENLACAIGPAACGRMYEVGQDVIDEFTDKLGTRSLEFFTPTKESHALVDLHLANKVQLLEMGVKEANIWTAPFCTMERPDLFFSYRLEKKTKGKTGRLMSVIGRTAI